MTKRISIFIFSIPALLVAGMLVSCSNEISEIEALNQTNTGPALTSYDCTLNFSDAGYPLVSISGPQMDQHMQNGVNKVVMNHGITALFYDSAMNVTSTLTADKGIFNESQRTMEVEKNVQITNETGDTLQTDWLIWHMDSTHGPSRDRAIYTDRMVYIYKEGTRLNGRGMYSRSDFSKYTLLHLHGDLVLPEEEER